MKIPPFCRNLGIFYHILGGLHRFCWEADEMVSLSTYAIGDLSMAFVLEGYFVEKF